MALFGRRKEDEESPAVSETKAVQEQAETHSIAQVDPLAAATNDSVEAESLAEDSGLMMLVRRIVSLGEGQMTLSLKQDNEDMQLRLYNNGSEVESSIVTPQDDWFTPVAKLYTDEEKARGAWNRALIVINPPVGDELTVQASYLNTVERTSNNLKYLVHLKQTTGNQQTTQRSQDSAASNDLASSVVASATASVAASAIVSTKPETSNPATEPEGTNSKLSLISERFKKSGEKSADYETESELSSADTSIETTAAENTLAQDSSADEATESKLTGVKQEHRENDYASNVPASLISSEEYALPANRETTEQAGSAARPVSTQVEEDNTSSKSAALVSDAEEKKESSTVAEDTSVADKQYSSDEQVALPAHIDDWAIEDDTFGSAPATASEPDVTSFVPRVVVMPPSTKKMAEGNLVLSEAEVVSRLMPAHDALFGANGTALDAASVLVRIRSLGSYYDALTHVRRNGFWDQQRTFDLIPEGVLKALELKAASYKEGSGAPLAMSIRFTPGIPPVASFDYSNEQAFVEYGDTLPAHQYVEELRMFPRTGTNIPSHMSEALASWTL